MSDSKLSHPRAMRVLSRVKQCPRTTHARTHAAGGWSGPTLFGGCHGLTLEDREHLRTCQHSLRVCPPRAHLARPLTSTQPVPPPCLLARSVTVNQFSIINFTANTPECTRERRGEIARWLSQNYLFCFDLTRRGRGKT